MGNIQRPEATLEDRWEKAGETVLLTGIQALVRLPLLRPNSTRRGLEHRAAISAAIAVRRSAATTSNC